MHVKKVLMLAAAVSAALSLGVPTASANGPAYCGSLNMLNAWPGLGPGQGVGVQPGGGMENAMTRDNPKGNEGMFRSIEVSCG